MTEYASAEGKVILLGEHAVVYGHPAIVTGIAKGARAQACHSDCTVLELAGIHYGLEDGDVGAALRALLAELGTPSVRIVAEILAPAGLGLGASAALGVAIARAVMQLTFPTAGTVQSDRLQVEVRAAQAWETVFHGTPSGIDVSAAALGGCFQFTRQDGPTPLVVARPLCLAIAVVGPKVSTKVMVSGVASLREKNRSLVDEAMLRIHDLVSRARTSIELGELATLGQLMDLNQSYLSKLLLSTEALDVACCVARDAGALGAKLTGKGGGGCVVALCEDDPVPVLTAWQARGLETFTTHVRATCHLP